MPMFKKPIIYLVIISILMLSGCFIKGRVVDENGAGVAGVTMTLADDDDPEKAEIHMTTTTDSLGYYQFGSWDDTLPVGEYRVAPSKSGYAFTPALRLVDIGGLGEDEDIPSAVEGVDFKVKTEDPTPLKWVLVGEPVINRDNAPLDYYGGGTTPGYYEEERFKGKWEVYFVYETSIAKDEREVDHGFEYFDTYIESFFDAPQRELIPGDWDTLSVKFTHSGSVHSYPPSESFEYRADRSGIIEPYEAFTYAPWHQNFTGQKYNYWTLIVPDGKAGDTFEIYAFWWNGPPCNVTWKYQME